MLGAILLGKVSIQDKNLCYFYPMAKIIIITLELSYMVYVMRDRMLAYE